MSKGRPAGKARKKLGRAPNDRGQAGGEYGPGLGAAFLGPERGDFAAVVSEGHEVPFESDLGQAQTDIASLHADQVDLENETIHFRRRKLAGKESGGESLLRIGPSLKRLLHQLPKEGYLFPM